MNKHTHTCWVNVNVYKIDTVSPRLLESGYFKTETYSNIQCICTPKVGHTNKTAVGNLM